MYARTIRLYRHGDYVAIATIFARAIHEIACEVYSPEQCLAWSSRLPNEEHWQNRCQLKRPFVALAGNEIAGFLELDPDGHIDCACVHPDFRRQGVVTSLVNHAVDVCFASKINRVYVEASICAKPLFEKAGFRVIAENLVSIGGIEMLNYKMERLRE